MDFIDRELEGELDDDYKKKIAELEEILHQFRQSSVRLRRKIHSLKKEISDIVLVSSVRKPKKVSQT